MIESIEGTSFQQMIFFAAAKLRAEKQVINDLNVFPVPDGDTGTNMSLTIDAAVSALQNKTDLAVGEAAAITASALLRGARGNSGVILSLLFRGMARSLKDTKKMDGKMFASALSEGVSAAYGAVMKPAEGTILTVSRMAAARAQEAAEENLQLEFVLQECIQSAEFALNETVFQNPVLEKAGVVDAGGKGFLLILQGMLECLQGNPMPEYHIECETQKTQTSAQQQFRTEDIRFGYCTEFICSRDNKREPQALKTYLSSMGDSLVLVEDDDIIKVHVHTNHPGKVLEQALTYGALLKVKVENMREQHTQIIEDKPQEKEDNEGQTSPAEKKFGFVAVCAGEGLEAVFRDLGVDSVVSGGQTMNPATDDILKMINLTPAETVFVLPNNKNIIMAAQQCIPLSKEKNVIVIETKSVPQGIAAMMAVDLDSEMEEIAESMKEASARVTTAQITYAARNSNMDGMKIKEGDYLALIGGQLFATDRKIERLLKEVAKDESAKNAEFITIFTGCDVKTEESERIQEIFSNMCPEAEVSVVYGGQPVYYYLISME